MNASVAVSVGQCCVAQSELGRIATDEHCAADEWQVEFHRAPQCILIAQTKPPSTGFPSHQLNAVRSIQPVQLASG